MPLVQKQTTAIGIFGRWDEVRTARISITPEQAKFILDNHMPMNRHRNKVHVNKLATVLSLGHWKFNGETIIFDRDGNLKDGQHRLCACVQSGVPIDTLVAFGLDPEVFDTIGRCKPRGLKDDLDLEGETNVNCLAACLRLIFAYETGERTQAMMSTQADSITLRDFLDDHPDIRSSSVYSATVAKKTGGYIPVSPRVVAACHYLFGIKDEQTREFFFESLRRGEGLTVGDPILTLRNRLFIDRSKTDKHNNAPESGFMQFNIMIRAWNAVRKNRRLSVLIVGHHALGGKRVPDPLPEII